MARRQSPFQRLEESLLKTVSGVLEAAAHLKQVDPLGWDQKLVHAVEPIAEWLYTDYWRVQVVGSRHIPAEGRAMIVANHSGTLPFDGVMLHLAVRRRENHQRVLRFLVDDFVYRHDLMGELMQRLGGVRASPENAKALLRRDELVAVFPEGVKGLGKLYGERYQLQRFGRGGFVCVAAATETPIIPCAIVGAEEIYPILWKSEEFAQILQLPYLPVTPTFPHLGLLGLIPLPSQWVIVFGEPFHIPKSVTKSPQKIDAWSRRIQDLIQKMLLTTLSARRSVWRF